MIVILVIKFDRWVNIRLIDDWSHPSTREMIQRWEEIGSTFRVVVAPLPSGGFSMPLVIGEEGVR